VGLGVGVHFPAVEWLRHKGEPVFKEAVTVGGNIGNMATPPHYQEWQLRTEADIPPVGSDIKDKIDRLGLPFLATYSSLERVKAALEADHPLLFSAGEEDRLQKLAVIHYVGGDIERGIDLLKEAYEKRREMLPKYWIPIKELLDFLAAQPRMPRRLAQG
jgi:hypothetical protein